VNISDALAFSVPGPDGEEVCVLVVQCRDSDSDVRADLIDRLKRLVHLELGIDTYVELVPSHTLPRTSSGKLSRSKARQQFIERHDPIQLVPAAAAIGKPAGVVELKHGTA
jgi:fatty-acyl-CoA synthase